jgi:hypothetical protein
LLAAEEFRTKHFGAQIDGRRAACFRRKAWPSKDYGPIPSFRRQIEV